MLSRVTGMRYWKGLSRLPLLALCAVMICALAVETTFGIVCALIWLFSILVCARVENREVYVAQQDGFLLLNALGGCRQRIGFDQITAFAIVGAAFSGYPAGMNKRYGKRKKDGGFIYSPYLLVFTRQEKPENCGVDARNYSEYALGMFLEKGNADAFQNAARCSGKPVYVASLEEIDLSKLPEMELLPRNWKIHYRQFSCEI